MEIYDIQPLLTIYHRKMEATDLRFKRSLYDKINWNARMVGLRGARGVGKTTMLLQRIKETYPDVDNALYVSLDNIWFSNHNLEELVEYLYVRGVTNLYFDEVHRFRDWAVYLKNFYDSYPNLKIVYTGSSILAIDYSIADLSRRQSMYTLGGLSFREYLSYEGVASFPALELADLLANHVRYAMDVCSKVRILKYFDDYLRSGYYPYYKEDEVGYPMRVADVARIVIENDIPAMEPVSYETVQKLKTLLMIIAANVPFTPNVTKLAEQLGSSRDQTLRMLYLLDRAGLLCLLTDKAKDYKHLVNPAKIYLNNGNLMYALSVVVNEGTLRETFFANQVGLAASLTMPKSGDFLVDGKYLFEVGGSRKSFRQIADIPDSYLAVTDIEVGYGNRIPLWLFGFLS